jgi:hypothetical protein
MSVIEVTVRTQYGREVFDPKNDAAARLASIAGTKTLTAYALHCAEYLGHEVLVYQRAVAPVPFAEYQRAPLLFAKHPRAVAPLLFAKHPRAVANG